MLVVKCLKHFLLGRKFKLETDHRRLNFLFAQNKEIPKTASAKITRWAISRITFDYEIYYQEGSSIPHVDAMSRLSFDQDDNECNLVDYLKPNLDEFCVYFVDHKLIPFKELRSERRERDKLAKRSIRYVIDSD